jgi:hypothetical protein
VHLEGLVTRRIDLLAMAGYSGGATVLNQLSHLDFYTANARLRFALTRSFALYSEYLYFNYDMRGLQRLNPGLPRVFEQHGVRVGLMAWASPF